MARRNGARRWSEVRAKWSAQIAARRPSNLRQSDCCCQSGVDPKYFSVWKGRLVREAAELRAPAATATPVTRVPVVLAQIEELHELCGVLENA